MITALRIFIIETWIDYLNDQRRRNSARLARAYDKRARIPMGDLWDAAK